MKKRMTGIVCAVGLSLLGGLAGGVEAATLIAHYDFQDSSNLGLDSSGNGNDLIAQGLALQAAGRDGAESALQLAESHMRRGALLGGFTATSGLTYAAWVNRPGNTAFDGVISQDAGGCCNFRLLLESESERPYLNSGTHSDFQIGGGTPENEWFHIVMTITPGAADRTTDLYINGAHVGSDTRGPLYADPSVMNLYVGGGENGSAHMLTGLLDDVQVYDGALSASEVDRLFRTGSIAEAPTGVPAPASAAMVGIGALALIRRRRR